jgi:hypothetical protein
MLLYADTQKKASTFSIFIKFCLHMAAVAKRIHSAFRCLRQKKNDRPKHKGGHLYEGYNQPKIGRKQ